MTVKRTVFMIDPPTLRDLNATEGTQLVSDLIRCEATEMGIPAQRVVVSLKTTARDGGIDAKVEDAPAGGSLLLKGSTYFQIKTGESFKPWRTADLKKELFGKSKAKPSKAHLGAEVRRALGKGGRYVLVTLGHDLLPIQHSDATEQLRKLFAACGYKSANVEVLGQGQIVGHIERFPSLCLGFNGLGGTNFQSIESWRKNSDMKNSLVLADEQMRFIEDIREAWRGSEFQHIRIIGEPGIGKTRLILEAALADDLKPHAIYIPHAEDFQNSVLFTELLRPDRKFTVSLVVDECEERERASIWNALKGRPRIKLITIDHGPETSSDVAMEVLFCPSLPAKQIGEILATYIGPRPDVSKWTEWCEGSPRVAHAVGENLKRNPEDVLKPPATVPIWDRFIVGHQKLDSKTAEEHRLVLRHIALFQRFGLEEPVTNEAKFISELVAESDPNITWAKFQRIVRHHQKRRILQGHHTLFIVPKALHVHLWLGYWNDYGVGFDFEKFLRRLPKEMIHWFLRLFIYAHATPVAQSVVKGILTPSTGPFGNPDFLISRVGTRFLDYLAEADAPNTLAIIERTIGQWSLDSLRAWDSGRQDIVFALEKIAVWRDLFTRAAKVLSRMALAENTNHSNNAKGTLIELFSIGPGWAATQASADIRFPSLSQLIKSADSAERELGLEIVDQWLSPRGGSRIVGAEYQGMRPTIEFWGPKTYGEWYECWRTAWQFLWSEVKSWTDDWRMKGMNRLITAGAALLPYEAIASEVMQTLEELAEDSGVDRSYFIEAVIRLKRRQYQKLPAGIPKRVRALDKKLTGTSFLDRFPRFVLFTTWDEDYADDGDEVEPDKNSALKVELLAKESLRIRGSFKKHLPMFISREGHRLAEFGMQISRHGGSKALDDEILAALEERPETAKSEFVGGYLSLIRDADVLRWESFILKILENAKLQAVGINASFHSGLSEMVARKLLSLYLEGKVNAYAFARLGYVAEKCGVSSLVVNEVVEAMLGRGEASDVTASIELVDNFYCRDVKQKLLPKDLTFRALVAVLAIESKRYSMREYHWHRVATRFREAFPEKDMHLLAEMLPKLDGYYRLGNKHEPVDIADQIVRAHPKKAWKAIAEALEHDGESKANVVRWLGDGGSEDRPTPGVLRSVDPEEVISWIEKSPGKLVPLLISSLPKTLNSSEGGLLTRRFIEKFGGLPKIADAVIAEFIYSGGWRGHESDYMSRKRDGARQWLSQLESPQVQDWLLRYVNALNEIIDRARIQEERQ